MPAKVTFASARPKELRSDATLPELLTRSGSGHLLNQIHGKNPYIQVEQCAAVGLGQPKYKLVNIT